MRRSRSFPNDPGSVPAARHFTAEVLDGCDPAVTEAAVLLVSELATNCVLHTGEGFELAVVRNHREIRVEARDRNQTEPKMCSPAPTDPHGRGLRIVDALASAWGVEHTPPGGKTVWFTLTLPAPKERRSRQPAQATASR